MNFTPTIAYGLIGVALGIILGMAMMLFIKPVPMQGDHRKWSWSVLALLVVAELGAFDKLSGGEVIAGLGVIAGTFVGGNVGEHIAKKNGGHA